MLKYDVNNVCEVMLSSLNSAEFMYMDGYIVMLLGTFVFETCAFVGIEA